MPVPGFDFINIEPEEKLDAEFNFGAKILEIIEKIKEFFNKLFKIDTL